MWIWIILMIKVAIEWNLLNIGNKILLNKNRNIGAIINKLNVIEMIEMKFLIVIRISAIFMKILKAKSAYIYNNFPGYLQISKINLETFSQMVDKQLKNWLQQFATLSYNSFPIECNDSQIT